MRPYPAFVLLLAVFACLSAPQARACGDKFLVDGGGAGYDDTWVAIHPASVLLYQNDASEYGEALFGEDVRDALEHAGHMVTIVKTKQLNDALLSGDYDIVLAELPDASAIDTVARKAPYYPVIVPLAIKPTKDELARARELFPHTFEVVEGGIMNLLTLLDEAVMMSAEGSHSIP